MSDSAEVKALRRMLVSLAKLLVERAGDDVEKMPALEGDEGCLVSIHSPNCPGYCEWGCGAVFVEYSDVPDGDIVVEMVEVGTLRASGLSGDA